MRLPWSAVFGVAASLVLAAVALGATPVAVRVTVERGAQGFAIPEDFAGVSYEMQMVLRGENGRHYFSPENTALLRMFEGLGIRHLRVGGNTADKPTVPVPTERDIDELFAFARAADVPVIYTLRLREGDPAEVTRPAKHVMERYGSQVQCLAVGNEPNVYAKEYPQYRDAMRRYYAGIREVAPGAMFCGPGATPGKVAWAKSYVEDFGDSGMVRLVTQHAYPGGSARKVEDVARARADMLSRQWVRGYEKMHDAFVPAARGKGLKVRIEEANSFFNGGAKDVSDTYAAALWGLDYMYWWSSRGIVGINFHTGDNVAAGEELTPCRYALFRTSEKGYRVHPMGYAVKMFALGSRGRLVPVKVDGADEANVTAYAVAGADKTVLVTLVNKEHGAEGKGVAVTIDAGGTAAAARTIALTAPGNDIGAQEGVTIGGAGIGDDGSWEGKWESMTRGIGDGTVNVQVPPATAVVVELTMQ